MPGFAYDMVIADKLRSFRAAYPDVEVEISINESFVDLFKERFHAGIRLGDRVDPDMIAVRVSPPQEIAVLASADYVQVYGAPASPEELVNHECIRYRFGASGQFAPWEFAGPAGRYSVAVSGKLVVNTLPSLYRAVGEGLGLGYSFADYRPSGAGPSGTSGGLVTLLRECTEPISGTFLYYPREYRSVELLRLFIDHVRQASP